MARRRRQKSTVTKQWMPEVAFKDYDPKTWTLEQMQALIDDTPEYAEETQLAYLREFATELWGANRLRNRYRPKWWTFTELKSFTATKSVQSKVLQCVGVTNGKDFYGVYSRSSMISNGRFDLAADPRPYACRLYVHVGNSGVAGEITGFSGFSGPIAEADRVGLRTETYLADIALESFGKVIFHFDPLGDLAELEASRHEHQRSNLIATIIRKSIPNSL